MEHVLDGKSEILGMHVKEQPILFDLLKAFDQIERNHKSDIFSPKRHISLQASATCSELPSNISREAYELGQSTLNTTEMDFKFNFSLSVHAGVGNSIHLNMNEYMFRLLYKLVYTLLRQCASCCWMEQQSSGRRLDVD